MIVEAGLAIIGLLLLNVFGDIMANKMTSRIIEVFDLVTPYVIIPTIVIVGPILEELIFRKILISWLNFALEGKITKNNAC